MGEVEPLRGPAGPQISRPSRLSQQHDLSKFFCRHTPLDDWLKHRALKSEERRTARTYVVCSGLTVVGYYCLATGAVDHIRSPRAVRRNAPDPVPAMVIGRLAVDRHYEGQGIGSGLLQDAIKRVLGAAEIVGCRAIIVHAIDDDAVAFYQKFGFKAFPDGERTLFLPLETIQASL